MQHPTAVDARARAPIDRAPRRHGHGDEGMLPAVGRGLRLKLIGTRVAVGSHVRPELLRRWLPRRSLRLCGAIMLQYCIPHHTHRVEYTT